LAALYVGIDVSKDFATAQGLDAEGKKVFYLEFTMDAAGFAKLHKAVSAACKDISDVLVAMESTGCYHLNLLSFLTCKGFRCAIINPLLINNFAKLSLRKTKTDKKDAMTIAQFLLLHKDALLEAEHPEVLRDLKDFAREHESLTGLIAAMKNDILRMLQITFPELESMANVFSQTMRSFLKKYPSARKIKTAKPKAIARALTHKDGRKKPPVAPADLIEAAKTSVASGGAAKEMILPEKISTLEHLIERKRKVAEMLVELCQQARVDDIEIIKSIGGVGDATASSFLAEIGDCNRFKSYKKLIAFAGLDPSTHKSGKYEGKSRISKRGNRHLRRIIYMMTSCIVRKDNAFREYFLKRRLEGLSYKEAIIATSQKLIRVIHTMLSSRTRYREGVMHNS
jgi:transposase